jgi:DNA-binding transcriptional LysR family regulator
MDWDKLRMFHAVAEAGSFTKAGQALGLSQSAVSRQISVLERDLNLVLFHRHARGLELTEQGEILFHETRDINRRIEFVTARLTDTKDSPSGELRITASVAFGSTWLTPRISEFIEMYPEINMTMLVSDFEIDLSQRTADVAIRLGPLTQPNLIARRILTIRNHIYASKDYLARHGTPMSIDDIEHHELIAYGATAPTPIQHINWLESMHIKARRNGPTLKINNLYGMLLAVEAGCGIAALPDYMTDGRSNVVRILNDLEGPSIDAHFVYLEEQRNTKRITVFRDFLLAKVAESEFAQGA